MEPSLWQAAATFGFAALMAVVIFVAYEKLVKEVVNVVRANTQTSEALCNTVANLAQKVDALERTYEKDR